MPLGDDFDQSVEAMSRELSGLEVRGQSTGRPAAAVALQADLQAAMTQQQPLHSGSSGPSAVAESGVLLGAMPADAVRGAGQGHEETAPAGPEPSAQDLAAHHAAMMKLATGVLGSEAAAAEFLKQAGGGNEP